MAEILVIDNASEDTSLESVQGFKRGSLRPKQRQSWVCGGSESGLSR
jgi:hypothetical protein